MLSFLTLFNTLENLLKSRISFGFWGLILVAWDCRIWLISLVCEFGKSFIGFRPEVDQGPGTRVAMWPAPMDARYFKTRCLGLPSLRYDSTR